MSAGQTTIGEQIHETDDEKRLHLRGAGVRFNQLAAGL